MTFLHVVIAILLMAANVLWYRIKHILRSRGYPISYLSHGQDLRDFRELIEKEKNPARREQYVRIRNALYASLAAGILLFLTLPFFQIAGAIAESRCPAGSDSNRADACVPRTPEEPTP